MFGIKSSVRQRSTEEFANKEEEGDALYYAQEGATRTDDRQIAPRMIDDAFRSFLTGRQRMDTMFKTKAGSA